MKKFQKLPESELLVMQILWEHGELVSSDTIVEQFNQHKPWERAAVLTLLKRLEKKGFLRSGKNGKYNVYSPLIEQQDYLQFESKSFLERMCGNSVKNFVATLYDSKTISKEDLEELRKFIEEAK